MDQVSRPLLIALAGVIALLAVWLVALRPKPVSIDKTPLAPVTAIPKAKQAAAASDAANAKLQAATGGSRAAGAGAPAASAATPATAPAAAAKPAVSRASSGPRLDGGIVREMKAGKVVVVLFWDAKAADDIATRGVLRGLDLHRGKVAVHVVPITQVGRYPAITEGITIAQSPTTLVIGPKRSARVIVGLTESKELSQAVDDALAGR
ncbi:MAG TPA: hypothetical protein VL120_14225 [Solirubrobacteraceae bacterium]|jgi:hypothetical protein|nr:hypothetical protein [Solirubrobacteraceae bacterium]